MSEPKHDDEQRAQWREQKADYRLRTRGPARVPQPCGTVAAYRRHLYHGETPCDACRNAEKERNRDRRRNNR